MIIREPFFQLALTKVFKKLFILPIKFYQIAISPILGPTCRFDPTCSAYMVQSIQEWGVIKGIYLGLKRIGRCHPWGKYGHDPVPKNPKNAQKAQKKSQV